ncbi:Serine/threonine-protein kinase PknB [Corynebacterium occultum]|uniref:non-specific serine/threonine protein kinase n=2 Tax=Corynebacterium occultum TaxID=2675219 RepID=A0A6B8W3P1_9CORY|nr:Serine/threonine-protein kinase PknB [Corynebacterium occultum]
MIGDRYELRENIGNGGMSQVYAAEDTLIGREVAVKMLRVELARDANFRERFRREAQNSGRLNHPSIVSIYDTGESEIDGIAIPYIVMERVHGRTLRDVVREDGPLSPAAAAEVLEPACAALQASHEAGIIHRDIKPANIMITNTGRVKVMDFGIARALDDNTSAMTQTSAVIGTAQYLSPEQARGKPADARSDIYALGCVLYEIITGQPPFEGETPFAVAYQHVQEEATPPSELISGLNPTESVNVDAVVLTAMAKHPADRYQDANEMGADLDLLARNAVTKAARTHLTPEAGGGAEADTRVSREANPTAVVPADDAPTIVAGGGYGAAGAGVAATQVPAATGGNRSLEGRRPTGQRKNRWLATVAALLTVVVLGMVAVFAWDAFRPTSGPGGTQTIEMVTIPDVIDKPANEAVSVLEELGLNVDTAEEPSPDIEEGNVIRVEPVVGSQLQAGARVTLVISTGEEMTNVPDITGMTTEAAAQALAEAGLELDSTVREETDDNVPVGLVIEQTPVSGTELAKGSRVSITVSTGAEQVLVPSLTGMQWSQAESTLISLGFTPQAEYIDSQEDEDTVLNVDAQGSNLPRGSVVTVQVSNGQQILMPDITRVDRADALRALRDAGWSAPDSSLVAGDPVGTAVLIDQDLIAVSSPEEGAVITKDTQINVRYYRFDLSVLNPIGDLP